MSRVNRWPMSGHVPQKVILGFFYFRILLAQITPERGSSLCVTVQRVYASVCVCVIETPSLLRVHTCLSGTDPHPPRGRPEYVNVCVCGCVCVCVCGCVCVSVCV